MSISRHRPNYVYAILSVALVLFLLGFFGATLLYSRQMMAISKESIPATVEIADNADSTALVALRQALQKSAFVRAGSLRVVTKAQKLVEWKKEFSNDSLLDETLIPFYDTYEMSIKDEYLNREGIDRVKKTFADLPAVNFVDVGGDGLATEVAKNVERVAFFAFLVALLFILVAATLIHNTIRLTLYADRFLIRNMELVGASWDFISRPYIIKSVRNGLVSGLLAIVFLVGIYFLAQYNDLKVNVLLDSSQLLLGLGGLVLLGVLISWASTYYVVQKYLRMRIDDLY
jgi:cell division transport system permease protein